MYYETMDLCKKARAANKKIYVCKKIKFTHYGAQSINPKFSHQYSLNRSWHYNWSKFYYFKKNFGYFFALRKILPNFSREIEQHCASPLGAIYNPANGSGHRDLFFRYCFIDNTNYIFSIFH